MFSLLRTYTLGAGKLLALLRRFVDARLQWLQFAAVVGRVAQRYSELLENVPVVYNVHVLADLHEQEPVAQIGVLQQFVNALLVHELRSSLEQRQADVREEDDREPVEQNVGGYDGQQYEPEPEEHVDLLERIERAWRTNKKQVRRYAR